MAPAKLHLTYFNVVGLGEPIRNACAIGKIELGETRIDFNDWPTVKDTFKTKQLPLLTVDGESFTQSSAMLRYVGSQVGLYEIGTLASFRMDEVMGMCEDLRMKIAPMCAAKEDLDLKSKLFREFLAETVPLWYGIFEEKIKANGTFVARKSLSIADLLIDAYYIFVRDFLFPDAPAELAAQLKKVYAEYPGLIRLSSEISGIPEIAAYRKK